MWECGYNGRGEGCIWNLIGKTSGKCSGVVVCWQTTKAVSSSVLRISCLLSIAFYPYMPRCFLISHIPNWGSG